MLLRCYAINVHEMHLHIAHFSPADFRRGTQINTSVYLNEIACSIYSSFIWTGKAGRREVSGRNSRCRCVDVSNALSPRGATHPLTSMHSTNQKPQGGDTTAYWLNTVLLLISKKQHHYNLTNMPLNDVSFEAPVHMYVPGGNPSREISVWPEVSKNWFCREAICSP